MRTAALTDEITIYPQAGGDDEPEFGVPNREDDDPVVVPALVASLDATEDEINREVRLNRYSVTLAGDVDLKGIDEIEWKGLRYRVIGEPRMLTSYRGELDHLEVEIRREAG